MLSEAWQSAGAEPEGIGTIQLPLDHSGRLRYNERSRKACQDHWLHRKKDPGEVSALRGPFSSALAVPVEPSTDEMTKNVCRDRHKYTCPGYP